MESAVVLAGKFGVGLLCAILAILLVRHRAPYSLEKRQFDFGLIGLVGAMRLSLFVVVYLILDINVTGDVRGYYFPEAEHALNGQVIYRDFESSYSPLFPYLLALVISIWHSLKAIILVSILIELASLPLWLAVGRRWFPERTVRTAALLYAASPIPFLNIALKGQNQVWVSLGLAASLWLLARRDIASGLVQGLTLLSVKVLSLLFAPVIWLFAESRGRWTIALMVLPLAATAYCLPHGIDLLSPLRFQSGHFTGGNLPYLTSILGIDLIKSPAREIYDAITLLSLATVFLIAWRRGVRKRPACVIHLLTLVLLTFFLASKKAYASYLVMCFFPVCLTMVTRPLGWRGLIAFTSFGILASLEPSLHFRWMFSDDLKQYLSVIWMETLPDGVQRSGAIAFMVANVLLVAGYLVIARVAWKRLFETPPTVSGDSPPDSPPGSP